MEETVSVAYAHRKFSLFLHGVLEGRSYVVTSHGRPVARLVPNGRRNEVAGGARAALLNRLERQVTIDCVEKLSLEVVVLI